MVESGLFAYAYGENSPICELSAFDNVLNTSMMPDRIVDYLGNQNLNTSANTGIRWPYHEKFKTGLKLMPAEFISGGLFSFAFTWILQTVLN